MARIRHDSSDSYGGQSHGSTSASQATINQGTAYQPDQVATRRSSRKKITKSYSERNDTDLEKPLWQRKVVPRSTTMTTKPSKQVRLTPLRSLQDMAVSSLISSGTTLLDGPDTLHQRTPANANKVTARQEKAYQAPETRRPQRLPANEVIEEVDIEGSVWCGSDASSDPSEDELPGPREFMKFPARKPETCLASGGLDLTRSLKLLSLSGLSTSGQPGAPTTGEVSDSSRPTSSSDKENDNRAILRFSPPRLHSPWKQQVPDRPTTPPPTSPSKRRLLSPSKRMVRVPTPPLRQSLDAFWNAETVNDWNDQYSPRKEWSPKKVRAIRDAASTSPTVSPKKLQSPAKRTKAEIAAKKNWQIRKHQIATAFFAELDHRVTNGELSELAASTGGVQFIWSKTLNSTAGRANWRRETTKTRQLDGSTTVTQKHHASIELAEKVIDDEERLLNVVAHEFCHLASFMISGIKDQPHGKQFKEWGRKCTCAFSHRGVDVTTKHSYQIEYKYIWRCSSEECAAEFKRHSKSIDPKRHTCGACRGKLLQVKPVPRKDAGSSDGVATGYAAYVKKHFASVKASLPAGASHKEVMEAVGRQYRAEKALLSTLQAPPQTANTNTAGSSSSSLGSKKQQRSSSPLKAERNTHTSTTEIDDMARVLEVITIDDD